MGWTCRTCGDSTQSDALDFVMMHDPSHDVEPSEATALRWGRTLGGDA